MADTNSHSPANKTPKNFVTWPYNAQKFQEAKEEKPMKENHYFFFLISTFFVSQFKNFWEEGQLLPEAICAVQSHFQGMSTFLAVSMNSTCQKAVPPPGLRFIYRGSCFSSLQSRFPRRVIAPQRACKNSKGDWPIRTQH